MINKEKINKITNKNFLVNGIFTLVFFGYMYANKNNKLHLKIIFIGPNT